MVYAFARDGGLPASSLFAQVHERGVPLNALCLTTAITILFGCVFVFSSAAFNAISSASVVALSISYALPIAVNCIQGRVKLPARALALPGPFAWLVNLVGVSYSILTSILFLFPPEIPVDSANMNYGGLALILVLIVSIVTWNFHGRQNYRGPAMLQYDSVPGSVGTDDVATQGHANVAGE
jgi:choline transport protein